MAYKFALPLHIKFPDMFHVEKKKKINFYMMLLTWLIWNVVQVEPEKGISFQSRFKDDSEKELNWENEQ